MNNAIDQPHGIIAAALTPLKPDFTPDLDAIPGLLHYLAERGCHGSLILGTTGEGPSFSSSERQAIYQSTLTIRQAFPDFKLFAGTGTPSQEETISLTRLAFDLGFDGVVVLPPYYFRKVSEEGLIAWFSQVIQRAVPDGRPLLYYHFPSITGIDISIDFLSRLKQTFPDRFAGLKDSSGNPDFSDQLGERFGQDLVVFTGNDRLLSRCLENHGSGCITAMSNLYSPMLRQIWDAFQHGHPDLQTQGKVSSLRTILERYTPFPPILKGLISLHSPFPTWPVRPPLLPSNSDTVRQASYELAEIG